MKSHSLGASFRLSVVLSGLLFAGCATTLPKFQITIESDPPGMRMEVNNEYIGVTPTVYTVGGNADRSFNGSWVQQPSIEFVATPPHDQPNLFVQRKAFSPSAFFKQGDHIPEKIFFDMHHKTDPSEHFKLT
ncbi:MAG: PEGA domain-containing protein [Limisphaerales bacterium]